MLSIPREHSATPTSAGVALHSTYLVLFVSHSTRSRRVGHQQDRADLHVRQLRRYLGYAGLSYQRSIETPAYPRPRAVKCQRTVSAAEEDTAEYPRQRKSELPEKVTAGAVSAVHIDFWRPG